jgi:hypothetical protein
VTEDAGGAARGGEERGQKQHGGGLAGAVGPEESHHRPAGHLEIEGVERAHVAVVAPERLGLDGEAHARCGSAITR